MPKPDKIPYKGRTMSMHKWSQKLDISTEEPSGRLKKGLALHKAQNPRDISKPGGGAKW
ncbi:MAG: hypothetical protein V1897_19715 [Pseudomonadota bacterium]